MKQFTKIDPSIEQSVGLRYKRVAVIKKYMTEDGLEQEFTTFYKEGSRSAAVIAVTADGKIVTTYEFRGGPERWFHELPGGTVESGEDVMTGALRELEEETGYRPTGTVEFLGSCHGDAYTNLQRNYFLAFDCVPGRTSLDKEESEQGAEVRVISVEELIENAKTDQMSDQVAVLMAYEKLRDIPVK